MSTIIGTVYSSRDFSFVKSIRCFIADISEVPEVLRQLRSEEFESGFGIRSAKTQRIVYFVLEHVLRNDEGEIINWSFGAENPHELEELRGVKAIIYND